MTIPLSTKAYEHYTGNDTLSVYPITFPTFEDTTVQAYVTNMPDWSHIAGEVLSGLKVFDLVLGTDFSLTNIAKPNTALNLLDASAVPPGWVGPIPARQEWLSATGKLNTGYWLYIEFSSNSMRPSVLANGNQLIPALSKDMDRLAMHIKATNHRIDEGFKDLIQMQTPGGAAGLIPPGTTPGEYLEFDGTDGLWQSGKFEGFSSRYGQFLSLSSLREAFLWVFNFVYTPPGISLSCSPAQSLREKGTVVAAVTMTATTSKLLNDITSVTHYRNGVLVDTEASPLSGGGVETYTNSTPFSDNMSFYSRVGDGTGTNQSNTVTYSFVYPYYHGSAAVGITAAAVAALTKSVISSSATVNKVFNPTSGQVHYFAYPASYGALTSILDENNFETFSDWTLRTENITGLDGNAVSYRIYEFNNPVVAGTTNYTFKR